MFLNQGLDGSMGYEIRYQFPDLNILESPFQQSWKILRNPYTNEQILYCYFVHYPQLRANCRLSMYYVKVQLYIRYLISTIVMGNQPIIMTHLLLFYYLYYIFSSPPITISARIPASVLHWILTNQVTR